MFAKNGNAAGVFARFGKERSSGEFRRQIWVQTLPSLGGNTKEFHVSLRRSVLPVRSFALWMGAVSDLVQGTNETDGACHKAIPGQGVGVLGRLFVFPAPAGRVATPRDCRRATTWIEKLLRKLGIVRHPTKGEWTGSTRLKHLGMVIDTNQMKLFICPRKIEKV
jgi:hypothetical protein